MFKPIANEIKKKLTLLYFLNIIVHLPLLTVLIRFWDCRDKNMKIDSQQYHIEPGVHAGLALYWWQKLIIFCSSRIRVNYLYVCCVWSGLDPADPYFQYTPTSVRLDPSDATFVDVMHTNGASILTLGKSSNILCVCNINSKTRYLKYQLFIPVLYIYCAITCLPRSPFTIFYFSKNNLFSL